jgi:hypothetical protein
MHRAKLKLTVLITQAFTQKTLKRYTHQLASIRRYF